MLKRGVKRAERPTVLLSLLLSLVLVAFMPMRWAFSERAAPDIFLKDQDQHAVARAIKADMGSFAARSTFDRLWMPSLAIDSETDPDQPAVNFAAADPSPETIAPFDALLADPEGVDLILRGTGLNTDDPEIRLALATRAPGEQQCLAEAIYFEARGETRAGQAAVAQVILNRVRSSRFPNTICGVVYQNRNQLNRCQFSFACDGKALRITDRNSWRRAVDVARQVLLGSTQMADVGKATHFHATYVRPDWAGQMNPVDTIGRHVFYESSRGL